MTLNSKSLAILVVVILFGGIIFSSSMGWWSTESNKEAAKFTEGEFAGLANPADIRGSYSLGDIEKNFGIPAEVVAKAFNIQSNDLASFQVKNLEAQYADSPVEIGTTSVRLFVALYAGLPFDLTSDIYLPKSAIDLLKEKPLSAEQNTYLLTHSAETSTNNAISAQPSATSIAATAMPATSSTAVADRTVKGSTTFADLIGWSMPNSVIEEILGMVLPSDLTIKIKDFAATNNLNFETLKPLLQAAVDKIK
jgi:hypothetical protein